MLNTIQMIVVTGRIITSYELLIWAVTYCLDGSCRRFASRSVLSLIALCSTLCLSPVIVNAQAVPANGFGRPPQMTAFRWWSPAVTEAAAPRLVANTTDLTNFYAYGSTSRASINGSREAGPMSTAILHPGRFWLTPTTQSAEHAFLQGDSLPHASYLSLLEVRYQAWESSLAENRTLTDVNGVSLYPLVQIEYGNRSFPIALSIAPLRGSSDVR